MENFETRIENAKKDFMHMDGDKWDNIMRLWKYGYSLRVISEVCGISRSKLQRFISENNNSREDDIRTQNRNNNVIRTRELWKNGITKEEIAVVLGVNVRTVDSYLRQLGIYEGSVFNE